MSTFWPFCRMKISSSSKTTAKKPKATQSPLVLVRFILSGGEAGAGAETGAAGGGAAVSGAADPAASSPGAGWFALIAG
jgi:hypothetical protein